jgi:PPR repeat
MGLSTENFKTLLYRLAVGHFSYLPSHSFPTIARRIRQDFIDNIVETDVGKKLEIDALVVGCYRFTHTDLLSEAVTDAIAYIEAYGEGVSTTPIYNALLSLLGRLDRVDAAQDMFTRLAKSGKDMAGTFDVMLKSYAAAGRSAEAEKIYALISKQAKPSAQVELAMVGMYAQCGDIQRTNKHFNLISPSSSSSERSKAFAGLIQLYAVRGLPGDALESYRKMRVAGLNASPAVYEHLIRAQLSSGDIRTAVKWFHKKENVPEFRPSLGMFSALIEAYSKAGDIVSAWRTLAESVSVFKKQRLSRHRLSIPLAAFMPLTFDLRLSDGSLKHMDYLRDMMRHAQVGEEGYIISRLMTAALSKTVPDAELAVALFEEYTIKEGVATDSIIPGSAYASAIKAHGLQKDPKRSTELFTRVIDEYPLYTSELYSAVICAQTEPKVAKEIWAKMKLDNVTVSVDIFEHLLKLEPALAGSIALECDSYGAVPGPKHPLVKKALLDAGLPILSSRL